MKLLLAATTFKFDEFSNLKGLLVTAIIFPAYSITFLFHTNIL